MNQSDRKRVLYFDALETLSIFLVVSVHSVWLNGNVPASISMSLSPAAVPVFFMVHGALLLRKDFSWKKHCARMVKTIFQLLAWSTIYLLICLWEGLTDSPVSIGYLYEYYVEGAVLRAPMGGVLWFIFALLSVYLLFPVLSAIKPSRKVLIYVAGISFLFGFCVKELEVWGQAFGSIFTDREFTLSSLNNYLSPFGTYVNCIFFFVYGFLLAEKLREWNGSPLRKQVRISCCLILFGIALMMLERRVEFGTFNYNWRPLSEQYMRVGTVLMATGLFSLFSRIPFREEKCGILVKISTHTIDIYYIHAIIVRLVYDHLFEQRYAGVLPNYLRALAVLVLSYWIGKIIRSIPLIRKLL